MIDVNVETVIPLKDVANILPRLRRGKKVSFSSLWRWARHGSAGVRLETLPIGRTLCTSKQAVQRFLEQLAAARGLAAPAGPGVPTRRQRDREIREAEERLAARGLYVQRKTGEEAGGPLGKGE